MQKSFLIIIGLLLIQSVGQSQAAINFNPRSPINHAILLSGSFGELRSNHFHSGIDIKSSSWNKAGDPVYAVESGYVTRIKIQGGGYGKAIYIDHPGGYTSVYGHLQSFNDSIEAYVKEKQYEKESFSINLHPDSTEFIIKKGDQIGSMGNTGRSYAPHLHFEIRHTLSELPVNPQIFQIGPGDNRPPSINRVKLVHMLPDSAEVGADEYYTKYIKQGLYKLEHDTLEVNAWRVGIEINAFDRMNGAPNKNGVYELMMFVNDQIAYHSKIDSFSFDESVHLNAHINYPDFFKRKARFVRCYPLPGNSLSIYTDTLDDIGIIALYQSKKQHIRIIANDISGNSSTIEFWVKRKKNMQPPAPLLYNYLLKEGNPHLIKSENSILYFPDSSLYQNCYLNLTTSPDIEQPLASRQLFINTQNNIFKNAVDIYLHKNIISDSLLNKACIVDCSGESLTSYGGIIFEDYINTKIKHFGNYAIFIDTIPPLIEAKSFSYNMKNKKFISFSIKDNLEVSGAAHSLKFKGYIDGKWVLFEFDAKTMTITHHFEKDIEKGMHHLRIELMDDRLNKTIFTENFIL